VTECDSGEGGVAQLYGRAQVHAKISKHFCPKGLSFCLITETVALEFQKIKGGGVNEMGRLYLVLNV
jgi:hypothetical protein